MNQEERISEIIDMIGRLASLDFSKKISCNNANDDIDIIGKGLNMLSEELEDNVVEKAVLENKVKELEQFSYVMSHDLKSPLRRINFLTHLLEEAIHDNKPEQVDSHLESIMTFSIQMENLINKLLEFFRIGIRQETYKTTDVSWLIKKVIGFIEIPENHTIHVQKNIPSMKLKQNLMFQVFSNLIENSIKYNDKDEGKTEITYKNLGNFHQFSVADNGQGIDSKYHDKIFELFRTLRDYPDMNNSGVGLPTVRKIVEMEKGNITLSSEATQGATFTFHVQNIDHD